MGICSESEMIPGGVNYEYLVVQLDFHLNKWRRHDDSLPSEPDRQHAMKSLTVFLLHNFFAVLHMFFIRVNIQSMQGCSTFLLQFAVVFEIVLTTDVMGLDAVFTTLHVVVLVTGQW